jgi:hypothetical protein
LHRERYYGLDEVGTRVWALLSNGADVPAVVAHLTEEFDAPAERIEADLTALFQQLTDDWKVVQPVEPPRAAREPSGFTCALTLIISTLALRVLGLRRSLVVAKQLGKRARRAADPSSDFLANVVRKVDVAAAFFPGRALCLEQSLALYVCLQRAGVGAELRIGAQPYPFSAHAWVEYRGELVGTSHDQVSKFVPFDRLVEAC